MEEKTKDIIHRTFVKFLEFMWHSKFPFSPRVAEFYCKISYRTIYNFLAKKYMPNLEQSNRLLDFMLRAREIDNAFTILVKKANFNNPKMRKIMALIYEGYGIDINRTQFVNILNSNLSDSHKARRMTIELMTESMKMRKAGKKTKADMSTKLERLEKE